MTNKTSEDNDENNNMHQEDQDRLEEIKEDNMEAEKKQQLKSKNPTT
jgi:hypothetical protein